MKEVLTILIVVLISCIGWTQTKTETLKMELEEGLSAFSTMTDSKNDLDNVNVDYFRLIIDYLDQSIADELNELDSAGFISAGIVFHSNDSTFGYYYSSYRSGENNHFSKNCFPQGDGTYSQILPTKNLDTISNVIITEPSNKKYEVYRSMCPGGATKDQAILNFKERLFGQYQLIVWADSRKVIAYFLAPPDPNSNVKLKHTTGKF